EVDAELEGVNGGVLVEDVRGAVLGAEVGAEPEGRGGDSAPELTERPCGQSSGELVRVAPRSFDGRPAGEALAGRTHRVAEGATRNEKLPLTMWPSVENTCHSTRQAPAVSADTVAVSLSAAPSLTSTVAGRDVPHSSSTRMLESVFSMRLLKRSEICGGPSLRVAPAAGDDSRSSECPSAPPPSTTAGAAG